MRKWQPPNVPANEEWQVIHQIVVPKRYREEILSLAHHGRSFRCQLDHFYWPRLKRDVAQFCRSCYTCLMEPVVPLQPIPACGEHFSQVIIDCVGSLPKTKFGNQYLLTIMCKSTHFPEAIPLRNIKAP